MEKILEIMSITIADIVWCIVIIVVTSVLLGVLRGLRNKLLKKIGDQAQRSIIRRANIVNVAFKVIKYFAIITCVLMVLQINGVNVSSVLTGIGIASVLAGISAQDMFKDLIQGLRIITDDFFSVGDYIEYNGEICRVIGFSSRTTTLKDVESEDTINICNRNILEARRLSGKVLIYIPLSYRVNTHKADEILEKSAEDILKTEGVEAAELCGLDSYKEEKAIFLLELKCNPGDILTMRRTAQRIILDNIYTGGLEMPVGEIDIINR